jgi:hypothetical protein
MAPWTRVVRRPQEARFASYRYQRVEEAREEGRTGQFFGEGQGKTRRETIHSYWKASLFMAMWVPSPRPRVRAGTHLSLFSDALTTASTSRAEGLGSVWVWCVWVCGLTTFMPCAKRPAGKNSGGQNTPHHAGPVPVFRGHKNISEKRHARMCSCDP